MRMTVASVSAAARGTCSRSNACCRSSRVMALTPSVLRSSASRTADASPSQKIRLSRQLVRETYQGSRAIARLRRGTASIDVRASVFCSVREPVGRPLCGFYAAAFTRLLTLFDIGARAEVIACRGTGEPTCVLTVAIQNGGGADRREDA